MMRVIIPTIFCFLIAVSSCQTYRHSENYCRTRELSWPQRSTTTKNISRTKCWNEDGKVSEKHFDFDETGCFHHDRYFSRGKEYFSNGKIKTKYHSRGKRETVREYYVTGGLKKKERSKKNHVFRGTTFEGSE